MKYLPQWRKNILAGAILATATVSSLADTTRKNIDFSIPSEPLNQALQEFAKQADIQLLYDKELVNKRTSKNVKGVFSVQEALNLLLQGTGLVFEKDGSTYVIKPVGEKTRESTASKFNDMSFLLEEIVVTATKREQNLQDIPMSVNAFSAERLEQSGIVDLRDIQFLAAGLHVNNQTGLTDVTIRGIGNNSFAQGAESGVAVHIDGVYLAQQTEVGATFFDVERIEVLRGPQGTLYGRNATSGAVNIISKAPTSEFEAGGSLTVGNYDLIETEGYASGPLNGSALMGRVAFKTRDNDGYTPNIYDGVGLDNDDFAAIRAKLLYEPTSDLNLDLMANFFRDDGVPTYVYTRGVEGTPLVGETLGSILPTGRKANYNNDNINEKESMGLSAKLEWDAGAVTLTSVTSLRKHSWFQAIEFDGSDQSLFFIDRLNKDTKQASQEFTLTSSAPGNLNWIIGANYFHNEEESASTIPLPTLNPPLIITSAVPKYEVDAYAAFGEASYLFLDRLTLTLGARYSYEKKSVDQLSGGIAIVDSENWSSFTPKAALGYLFTDNITAYITVSEGFKSGGFNIGTTPLQSFEPEQITNYELGVKTNFLDNRLRANIAAFHMDYADLQVLVQRTDPVTRIPATILDNAAEATIRGVELEVLLQATESFSLDGNLSFLDATFDEWKGAVDILRGGNAFDADGNRLLNSPEWAGNLGLTYSTPVGEWGSASFRAEYAYKGEVFFDPFESPFLSQDSFDMFNANITFEDALNKWRLSTWVKNLTDELIATRKFQSASTLTGRPAGTTYLPPRTYGVTVSFQFD